MWPNAVNVQTNITGCNVFQNPVILDILNHITKYNVKYLIYNFYNFMFTGFNHLTMFPLSLYNALIVIVYAILFWYLYKEDRNSRVINLQRPVGDEVKKIYNT
jgi:hypothetical protein